MAPNCGDCNTLGWCSVSVTCDRATSAWLEISIRPHSAEGGMSTVVQKRPGETRKAAKVSHHAVEDKNGW